MALDYEKLMANSVVDLPYSYTARDSMLYALSVGLGADPMDANELPYVTELRGETKTLPSNGFARPLIRSHPRGCIFGVGSVVANP